MKRLQLEKGGFRGLAVAESLSRGSARATLAGVVMRRDLVIDGFVLGRATPSGDDATKAILDMYDRLDRSDISYVLISGLIISGYNIVDIGEVYDAIRIPIIGITYRRSAGMGAIIRERFGPKRAGRYERLGDRQRITLGPHDVFVRCRGCTASDAGRLLQTLTLQGSKPEPVRVAQLLARAASGAPGGG